MKRTVSGVLAVLADVVGPVLLIGLAGYVLGRARLVDPRALTALSVWVMVPSLVFYALATAPLRQTSLAPVALYVGLQFLLLGDLVSSAARVAGWDRVYTTGLLLSTLFSNAGNAGLPLALFAWGTEGLHAAAQFFAIQALATNVLAAYLAARAGGSVRHALRALARLPVTYAIAGGLTLAALGIPPPPVLARAAQLLASGAVGVMLLLIGVQLSDIRAGAPWTGMSFAVATRLLIAPLIAWSTAPLLGLAGVVRQTSILQASLPTAVTTAIWAAEFGVTPSLVSSAVVATTLLSPVTVTALLVLLGTGR